MFDWVTGVVRGMGYIGIALLTLVENIFPPIPSEVIMPLAGFVAQRGDDMTLIGAIIAGTVGSLAGAIGWYAVGRKVGEQSLRDWMDRHGRWLTLDGDDIDRASRWFEEHGGLTVFFCRLIPGLRTFISLPAGFAEQSLVPFLIFTTAGTVLWTAALTYAGMLLGQNYDVVSDYLGPVSWAVFGFILAFYIVRVARGGASRSRRRQRKERRARASGASR